MPSTRLTDLSLILADAWLQIKEEFEESHPGVRLIVTCTMRRPEEQFELFKRGRMEQPDGIWIVVDKRAVVTNCDGYAEVSKHNLDPSQALDFAVVVNGKVSWRWDDYLPVGELAEAKGLIWGGRWKRPVDAPHLEVPE